MTEPRPDRLRRTLRRLLAELCWIRYEQNALRRLEGLDHVGIDFFYVAHTALRGDRLIRLVRVFDQNKRVASFWYVHRCREKRLETLLFEAGVRLADVQDLSERLNKVRNAVFVHIDKRGLFDPPAVYKAAALKGSRIDKVVDGLWYALKQLYEELSGAPYYSDEYAAADVLRLHRFHMARDKGR